MSGERQGNGRPEPLTWAIPAEPGPEVTAVRTPKGDVYDRDGTGWRRRWFGGSIPGVHGTWRSWHGLIVLSGELTDATERGDRD